MEAPLAPPRSTRRHPVADNPLRLLDAAVGLDWALPELRRRAATLAAAAGPRPPEVGREPGEALCTRRRAPSDYIAAAAALDDGLALAVAIAFFPDHWSAPRLPIGQANLLLLRAEGLLPGDPARFEALGQALLGWDGRQGVERLEDAVDDVIREATAGALKAMPPSVGELRARTDEIVLRLTEEILTEIGPAAETDDDQGAAAVWLLNIVEQLRRLPVPARAIASAEERLAERLVQPVQEFFNTLDALELGETVGRAPARVITSAQPAQLQPLPEAQVDGLLARFRQVHATAALAAARPTLARRLADAQALAGFEARRLLAGWQVGAISGRWLAAAELLEGIHPRTLESFPDPETRQTLRVALRVVPSLAAVEATGGADAEVVGNATAVLGGLKGDYAGCLAFLDRLETALGRLGSGEGALPLVVTPPPPERRGLGETLRAAWGGARRRGAEAWAQGPFAGWNDWRRGRGGRRMNFSAWGTGALALGLILGSIGYLGWSVGAAGLAPAARPVQDLAAPAAQAAPAVAAAMARPTVDPTLFTDSRGKTYRVPAGATSNLQAAESIIERRRREVQEMAAGLEALRQRIERERPGRGGYSAEGGDPNTAQARFEAKVRGYQRERELVREQERRLQGMVDAHRGRLDQLTSGGGRG